jgi:hypothetical protein
MKPNSSVRLMRAVSQPGLRVPHECYRGVTRASHGCHRRVTNCCRGVTRIIQACYEGFSRVLPECETVRGMVQGRWKDHGTVRPVGDQSMTGVL